MIKSIDELVETNNPNSPYNSDYRYGKLIIGGLRKTNVLLNLIKHQRADVEKVICTSRIHSDQSIDYLSKREKKYGLNMKQI